MTKILIGADPEIPVKHKTKGNISAHELIPGTKKNPFKVENGAVQIDGTALEFNINPAETADEFLANLHSVMGQLNTMVKAKDSDLEFDIRPAVIYDKELFSKLPDYAVELGCEPDFNAYTGEENPRPDSTALKGKETLRTFSGHIHIGWTEGADRYSPQHFEDCRILASALDTTLAAPAQAWDTDRTRALLYGKKGAFRPKPYGMEYRVLSNVWLSDPKLARFVFENAKKTVAYLMAYGAKNLQSIFGYSGNLVNGNNASRNHYDYYLSNVFGEVPVGRNTVSKYDRDVFARSIAPDGGKRLREVYATI